MKNRHKIKITSLGAVLTLGAWYAGCMDIAVLGVTTLFIIDFMVRAKLKFKR